jgi:hypothetical protein
VSSENISSAKASISNILTKSKKNLGYKSRDQMGLLLEKTVDLKSHARYL